MSIALASPFQLPSRASSGYGRECRVIWNKLEEIQEHEEKSVVLGWRQELRQKLADILDESRQWGGVEGEGESLDPCAIKSAEYLINLFPETDPLPDLVPTTKGGVAFEFDRGENYLFSLVATREGELVYAGIFGENIKEFGERVLSDELPRPISAILKRYFSKV